MISKENLITLGAICQKKFNMLDGFNVSVFPYNPEHVIILRGAMHDKQTLLEINSEMSPIGPEVVQEKIEMFLFGDEDEKEYIWCGYSSSQNTVCIMPSEPYSL